MTGNPLSPSKFPRASVRRTGPAVGGVAWGPQEEDAAHCFYHFGVRSVRLPPDTLVSGLASGQSSTEPICRLPEQALEDVVQASPVRRHAGACGFVEVDRHYEPPAAEAGAFKAVQRDTQWKSARSGTERDAPPLCPTLSGRAALPPSHIPSETVLVGRTPEPARGPLFIFRKILNYGKTKKSTHGHQTTKPFCTHFFKSLPTDQIDQGESNGGGPDLVRGLWPSRKAIEVGCRVASSQRESGLPCSYSIPTLYLRRF